MSSQRNSDRLAFGAARQLVQLGNYLQMEISNLFQATRRSVPGSGDRRQSGGEEPFPKFASESAANSASAARTARLSSAASPAAWEPR